MKSSLIILILTISIISNAQEAPSLPYSEIPTPGKEYNAGNILSRLVDGLGYRYYWATDGLTSRDLGFKPSEDARTTKQTLEHICGLSEMILNAAKNKSNIRSADWSDLTYQELRTQTLNNFQEASMLYQNKSAESISKLQVIFESNGTSNSFPFWNMINGPIADVIYHTGQVVSFRRSAGNPMNPKVNVFLGKTGK